MESLFSFSNVTNKNIDFINIIVHEADNFLQFLNYAHIKKNGDPIEVYNRAPIHKLCFISIKLWERYSNLEYIENFVISAGIMANLP